MRGGDIRQCLLAGREFDPAADSNFSLQPSTINKEASATGNGGKHVTGRRSLPGIADMNLSVDPDDYDFILQLNDRTEGFPVVIVEINGTVWNGDGMEIVGEIPKLAGDGTVTLELRGDSLRKK